MRELFTVMPVAMFMLAICVLSECEFTHSDTIKFLSIAEGAQ